MRKSILLAAVMAVSMMLAARLADAADGGTGAEAMAMLEKAIAELKAGEATALAKFNRADGGYRDRDLFVFCYNTKDGKFTAHATAALLGQDVRALKETDGSPLGQRMFDTNKAGRITTFDYMFPRPGQSNPVPREAFITVVGNQGCGVGYYW
jgi:hypothetical protein